MALPPPVMSTEPADSNLAEQLGSIGFTMQPPAPPVAPNSGDAEADLMGLLVPEVEPPSPKLLTPSNQDFAAKFQNAAAASQVPAPPPDAASAGSNPFDELIGMPSTAATPPVAPALNPFDELLSAEMPPAAVGSNPLDDLLGAETAPPTSDEPPLDDALEDLLAFAKDL